jgi:hypothetical protein
MRYHKYIELGLPREPTRRPFGTFGPTCSFRVRRRIAPVPLLDLQLDEVPEVEQCMRRALWIGLVLLVAGSAMPASAASAEFQGNCTNSFSGQLRTDCVFNAQRTPSGGTPTSCSPSTISNYFWDYGDGSSSGFTTSSFVSHTYYGAGIWDICLAVFCANGTSAEKCHCLSNNIGFGTCILPGSGWMP